MLREHLRVMGSGETTARFYRDKLAMRVKARDAGIPVPDFRHVLNYDRLREFMDRVPGPWVLKPRSMAGSIGIKKIHNQDEFWRYAAELGNMQSQYLLERFVPRRYLPRRQRYFRWRSAVRNRQWLWPPPDGGVS